MRIRQSNFDHGSGQPNTILFNVQSTKLKPQKSFLSKTKLNFYRALLLGAGITLSVSYLVSRSPLLAQLPGTPSSIVPPGLAATASLPPTTDTNFVTLVGHC